MEPFPNTNKISNTSGLIYLVATGENVCKKKTPRNAISRSFESITSHHFVKNDKKFRKTGSNFIKPHFTILSINCKIAFKEIGSSVFFGVMAILFIVSLSGFLTMWLTEYYNYILLSKIILKDNTERSRNWINPNSVYDTYLKVHIFNYTNIHKYLSGFDNIIKVADIGPLTYKEHTNKVNVSFNKNFTVTFREHRSYQFLKENSIIYESDKFMVPNVPLLTAAAIVENFYGFKKFAATRIINNFNEPVFKSISAYDLLWGYRDKIVSLDLKSGSTHFGLLMNRNGTSKDYLQINTGEDDIRKYSTITQFNGESHLNFWNDKQCNRIDGTDATMFPPTLLKSHKNLNVFLQVLCRKIPLQFEKQVTILNDINVSRYRTPLNVFGSPHQNHANECFCRNTEKCMLSGVVNATKCYNGAPIYPSFPHFFSGDKRLYKNFEGINPEASKHQTFADIHPRFGFPISGASRIQINIAIVKGEVLQEQIKRINDGVILPVIWIEITSGDFTDAIIKNLYKSTVGLNALQCILEYVTVFACVISFCLVLVGLYTLPYIRQFRG